MTKEEFISELRKKLSGLPEKEIEEGLSFYCEIIDDKIEEGFSEEEAVSGVGSVDEIASQILADIPITKIAKERIRPKRRMRAWEIVLLVLGSPIWISLGIAAVAVILSLYVVLWSVIASLWAVFGALAACGAYGLFYGGNLVIVGGEILSEVAILGLGMVCSGLSIFLFFGCKGATDGIIGLTKKLTLGIKRRIAGRERV